MRIALIVNELSISSAPKIVGEEAHHLNKLDVEPDVFVVKYRSNKVSLTHAKEIIENF